MFEGCVELYRKPGIEDEDVEEGFTGWSKDCIAKANQLYMKHKAAGKMKDKRKGKHAGKRARKEVSPTDEKKKRQPSPGKSGKE